MLTGWDSQTVVIGDYSGHGLLDTMDMMDQDKAGDPVLVRRTVLKVSRADFLNGLGVLTVARGDTATLDGVAYVVSDVRVGGADGRSGGEELDGRELHLLVRKV
jgi:hypothetical protein